MYHLLCRMSSLAVGCECDSEKTQNRARPLMRTAYTNGQTQLSTRPFLVTISMTSSASSRRSGSAKHNEKGCQKDAIVSDAPYTRLHAHSAGWHGWYGTCATTEKYLARDSLHDNGPILPNIALGVFQRREVVGLDPSILVSSAALCDNLHHERRVLHELRPGIFHGIPLVLHCCHHNLWVAA